MAVLLWWVGSGPDGAITTQDESARDLIATFCSFAAILRLLSRSSSQTMAMWLRWYQLLNGQQAASTEETG